jgi:hypothetical protein
MKLVKMKFLGGRKNTICFLGFLGLYLSHNKIYFVVDANLILKVY